MFSFPWRPMTALAAGDPFLCEIKTMIDFIVLPGSNGLDFILLGQYDIISPEASIQSIVDSNQ